MNEKKNDIQLNEKSKTTLVDIFKHSVKSILPCLLNITGCFWHITGKCFFLTKTMVITYFSHSLYVANYTPGIYADGYIAFAFPFVRSYVR